MHWSSNFSKVVSRPLFIVELWIFQVIQVKCVKLGVLLLAKFTLLCLWNIDLTLQVVTFFWSSIICELNSLQNQKPPNLCKSNSFQIFPITYSHAYTHLLLNSMILLCHFSDWSACRDSCLDTITLQHMRVIWCFLDRFLCGPCSPLTSSAVIPTIQYSSTVLYDAVVLTSVETGSQLLTRMTRWPG